MLRGFPWENQREKETTWERCIGNIEMDVTEIG
jgi:hypothetical protein